MLDSEIVEERKPAMTNLFPSLRVSSPVSAIGAVDNYPLIRALDVVIASLALVAFAPLMVLIALLVRLTDGGPAFFAHKRVGFGGRHFGCLKFRSMVVDADERLRRLLESDPAARVEWDADHKLRNDPRITALGRFLRKSSLDELPQLLNVLRGEMSLVGPRPIVDSEVERYGRYFDDYCSVKPGITGLWQVSGRNEVSYDERVALDVTFARSKCAKLYLKILILTVPSVLMRDGAY